MDVEDKHVRASDSYAYSDQFSQTILIGLFLYMGYRFLDRPTRPSRKNISKYRATLKERERKNNKFTTKKIKIMEHKEYAKKYGSDMSNVSVDRSGPPKYSPFA